MILHKTERITLSQLNKMELLKDLDEVTKNLISKYLDIEDEYRYALRVMSAKLENLDDYCQCYFDHNPIHHMESRIKTPESIIEKMHRREYDLNFETLKTNVYDIAGIRVICNYIQDIYQIVDLLLHEQDIHVRLTKDYIKKPKVSGYRSYHIIFDLELYLNNKIRLVPVEIQFRTIAMDMWASLEHELKYKSHNNINEEDKKRLQQYSKDLYEIDLNMQNIYNNAATEGKKND